MVDLKIRFCQVEFPNPLVLPAGIWGTTAALLSRAVQAGAGGVTTKSISLKPREGHPNPVVLDWGGGLINAVGLANSGAKKMSREIEKFKKVHPKTPLIASIVAGSVSEFGETAALVAQAKPDFLELNISCPNVEYEWGRPFATDPVNAKRVVQEVKRRVKKIPVIVKLSPNVEDIRSIALAVVEGGADAISAINTVGPGMVIDIESGRPVLSNKVGGISGPAITPVAIRCVYDIAKVVKIPILGMGGVTCWEDALQLIMAGASLVGVGSGIYFQGERVFNQINQGLKKYLKDHHLKNLAPLRGIAWKQ